MTTFRVKPPGAVAAATYTPEALVAMREMIMSLPDYGWMLSSGHVSRELRLAYREAMVLHEFKAAFEGRIVGVEDEAGDFPIPLDWLAD